MRLSVTEIVELKRRNSPRTVRASSPRCARLIPLLADGLTGSEIRAKLDCGDSYSIAGAYALLPSGWRVCSLVTSGAKLQGDQRVEARVLAHFTRYTPADGSPHWPMCTSHGGRESSETIINGSDVGLPSDSSPWNQPQRAVALSMVLRN